MAGQVSPSAKHPAHPRGSEDPGSNPSPWRGEGQGWGGGEDVPRGGGERRAGSARAPAGALETLEEARAEGIFSGHPAMPEYEYIPGEIADIIAWMNSLEAD